MLRVTQPQRHRRKIDREAGSLIEEILPCVADTALASDAVDALQGDGCRPQQYLGRTDPEDDFRNLERVERLRAADAGDVGCPLLRVLNRLRKRGRKVRIEVCRVRAG